MTMTMTMTMTKTLYPLCILAAVFASGCATTGNMATTKYSFNQPVYGSASDPGGGHETSGNTLTLWRAPRASTGVMEIIGQVQDGCLKGKLSVAIEQSGDTLVLMPDKTMSTCYDSRIVIRVDGTGGYVERRGYKAKEFARAWPDFDWGFHPI